MGKYKKHILYSLYLIAFCAMVYVAYTSSKYRPESVSILFTDLSWLGNWPKWLDLPLMPFLNEGFEYQKISKKEMKGTKDNKIHAFSFPISFKRRAWIDRLGITLTIAMKHDI